MLTTKLTQSFGLTYPIISAPIGSQSGANLAAAVSDAGGLGTFGSRAGATYNANWLREQLKLVRSRTDRTYAVGFIMAFIPMAPEAFDICIEESVPNIVFSFGDPRAYARRAKDAGIRVFCQVQTKEGAQWALEVGADVIIAQGNEAGGHSGQLNTLPILAMVLDIAGETPVVAAGGIANGRSLAAVLAAGAAGAMLGTSLMATPEATEVSEQSKRAIVDSDGEDTIQTRVFDIIGGAPWPSGIALRVRRNEMHKTWEHREQEVPLHVQELRQQLDAARRARNYDIAPHLMGQGAAFVNAIRPAASVVRTICEEAEQVLRQNIFGLLQT